MARSQLRLVMLMAVIMLAVAGCGGAEEREAKHVERGKELYNEQEWDKARIEFRNALKINPTNADAQYYSGLLNERSANWRGALANYSTAVQSNPEHLLAQVKLGQLYLLGNTIDKAEEQARIAAGISPNASAVLLLDASIALRKGDVPAARAKVEQVLAADPNSIDGASLLAAVEMRDDRPERAREVLDSMIAKHPKDVQLRLIKLRVAAEQKDITGVESVYKDLIEIDPENLNFRTQLARIYAAKDNVADAEALLRNTVSEGVGGKEGKLILIDLLAQRRSFEEAEAELKRLIAAEPGETAYAFKLADLYNTNKKPDQAETVLREVIAREGTSPGGLTARVGLARLMVGKGDQEQAEALIAEVLRDDPSNSDALLIRARYELARGDHQGAIGDLRTVLRNSPDSVPGLKMMADAQFQAGQAELAVDTLQRVVQLTPRDNDVRLRLAATLAQRGNRPAALKLLDETPSDSVTPQILAARGAMLIDQKQWTDAEAVIAKLREDPANQRLADAVQGAFHQARSEYPEAVAAYKKALEKDPTSQDIMTAIVRSMLAEQKTDEALAFLQDQTKKSPSNAVAHNLYGELLMTRNQLDAAEAALNTAVKAQPRWVVPYHNLARVYTRMDRPQQAVEITRRGLEEDPKNTGLMVAHASALETAGDYQAAITVYDQLLQVNPEVEVAINNYGALVADFRPKDQAAVQRALGMAKRFENSTNPLFVDTLGWLQYRAGDLPQARANLERAIKLRPDMPQLQYHLGMVLRDLGEKELARKVLERAVVDGANYPGLDEAKAALKKM